VCCVRCVCLARGASCAPDCRIIRSVWIAWSIGASVCLRPAADLRISGSARAPWAAVCTDHSTILRTAARGVESVGSVRSMSVIAAEHARASKRQIWAECRLCGDRSGVAGLWSVDHSTPATAPTIGCEVPRRMWQERVCSSRVATCRMFSLSHQFDCVRDERTRKSQWEEGDGRSGSSGAWVPAGNLAPVTATATNHAGNQRPGTAWVHILKHFQHSTPPPTASAITCRQPLLKLACGPQ
jgi:hypothetical protein